MTTKQFYTAVLERFQASMPEPKTELTYNNPFQLLVAVVLSAQCTDKRVNMVTPPLFKAFPTPKAMADATADEIFQYVKSVSYPNAKARHLHEMAVKLVNDFDSVVPETLEQLTSLPGVGRKTANVIMSVVFKKPTMAVDTHVFRLANRIGLTKNSPKVLVTEKTLTDNIPLHLIPNAHHWLILHGRYTCTARKPKCQECPIAHLCDYYNKLKKADIKK